jgi:hypothetical protein
VLLEQGELQLLPCKLSIRCAQHCCTAALLHQYLHGMPCRTSNLLVATTLTAELRPLRVARLLLLLLRAAGMPAHLRDDRCSAICKAQQSRAH